MSDFGNQEAAILRYLPFYETAINTSTTITTLLRVLGLTMLMPICDARITRQMLLRFSEGRETSRNLSAKIELLQFSILPQFIFAFSQAADRLCNSAYIHVKVVFAAYNVFHRYLFIYLLEHSMYLPLRLTVNVKYC